MEIDWDNAPEGAEIYHKGFGIYSKWVEGQEFISSGKDGGWSKPFLSWSKYRYAECPDVVFRPKFEATVNKIQQLRSLVQQSGLQIEFHADGTIYVWDDAHEEGTRVNSLDEYVRLAEAKAAYVKLWADYVWE